MDRAERQQRIIEYLKIRPLNRGQVETELLKVPNRDAVTIPEPRRIVLRKSLQEQEVNLLPIVIRRIEPDEEEREYEVVFGEDWVILAEELNIERMWALVFDLTDEQVEVARAEMAELHRGEVVDDVSIPAVPAPSGLTLTQVDALLHQRLEQHDKALRDEIGELTQIVKSLAGSSFAGSTKPLSGSSESLTEAFASLARQVEAGLAAGNLSVNLSITTISKVEPPGIKEYRELFDVMTVASLKSYASKHGIGLAGAKKKAEILERMIEWCQQSIGSQ
ncbi:hypothetical protein KR51_00023340 [Rubidibacter lacunae KORDI 51-2]|uniref:Rho termination factor N-terminal domain-containing protein n=1 Tax=Rubidibacter lacunae KORDI 51-2 TaxID=582515 RepID=U5DN06_9CHRO|nr:hypothetical protein [Rubidibacter lacunae]ERN41075.1 hypothetical protein KR51_00023340 [Rubidibacter lacunae KORDI 51-2]